MQPLLRKSKQSESIQQYFDIYHVTLKIALLPTIEMTSSFVRDRHLSMSSSIMSDNKSERTGCRQQLQRTLRFEASSTVNAA